MPTEADRNLFRDRLKSAIKVKGTSARALEETLGLTKGSFTKIYAGKKDLDAEILTSAAKALDIEAGSLVEGTSFTSLIPKAATPKAAPPKAATPRPAPARTPEPAPRTEPPREPSREPEPENFFTRLLSQIRAFFV